jgi:tetratricopeptide (TPR) repeat protein
MISCRKYRAIMNIKASLIRLTAVLLIVLGWTIPAFCPEIHDAARAGDLAKVKALLKENPKLISSKYDFGMMPLHWAAFKGYKDVAELLLINKADVNARDDSGDTPLYYAAKFGHKEVIELLLAKGGDANAKDKSGWTPLHIAAINDHRDIVELLLANNADINAKNNKGQTPLRVATDNNNMSVVILLSQYYEQNPPGYVNELEELVTKGVEKYKRGNYGGAIEDLKKVQELTKKRPQPLVFFNLGLCYYKQNNYVKAVEYLDEAIKLDATVPDFFDQKDKILLELGESDESIQAFKQWAELSDKSGDKAKAALSLTDLCDILLRNEKYDEALKACRRAVEIDPEYPEGHFYLGLLLTQKKETMCDAKKELTIYQGLHTSRIYLKEMANVMVEYLKDSKCPPRSDRSSAMEH